MTDRERRRPTMADVAALAGVSHQTVSRVLNDLPVVREDTRARVLAAAEELGYRRNILARALATKKTRLLGIVAFGTAWYGPAATLLGIQQAARDARYFVTVAGLDSLNEESLREAVDVLSGYSPDGFVVVTLGQSVSRVLAEMSVDAPLVTVGSERGTPDIPAVGIDQELGARLATEHLLQLGHRTAHQLAGPDTWLEAEARLSGWRDCLRERGAPVPAVTRGDWSAASGYRAAQELLRKPDVTAVFVANDYMALGLLAACRDAGVRIPEDLSVVGFDSTPQSEFFAPPLTSILQDFQAVGRTSIDVLLDLVEERGAPPARSVITPSLVTRSSAGAPRAGA